MLQTAVLVAPLPIEELEREGAPLFRMHYAEIREGQDGDAHDLEPDWRQYRAMEEAGILISYGVRDVTREDEPLVGYCLAIFVERHLHYPISYAQIDVMFIHPNYRGTGAASELRYQTRKMAKEMGASEIVCHAAPGSKNQLILDKSRSAVLRDYNYSEKL